MKRNWIYNIRDSNIDIYIIKKIIRNKDEKIYTTTAYQIQKLSKNIPIIRNPIN